MKIKYLYLFLLVMLVGFSKAQVSSINVPIDIERNAIELKVLQLEKCLNNNNLSSLSSLLTGNIKDEISKATGTNSNIPNKVKFKVINVEKGDKTANVICDVTIYNENEIVKAFQTVFPLERSNDWKFKDLNNVVEMASTPSKDYTSSNSANSLTSTNNIVDVQIALNPNALIRVPFDTDINEISYSLTQAHLQNQVYSTNASIDGAIYTINQLNPTDQVGLTLDNLWKRIIYARNTEGTLRSYGDKPGDIEFGEPVALDANEFGEIFVVDKKNHKIIKLQYSNSTNLITQATGFSISADFLINPTDLDYNSGYLPKDRADDYIVVADIGRGSIIKFDTNGNLIDEFKLYSKYNISYDLPKAVRLATEGTNHIAFIDTEQKLVMSGIMYDGTHTIDVFGDISKLPLNSRPVDITINSSQNVEVADNSLNMIHIFNYFSEYLYSYNGYTNTDQSFFRSPQTVSTNRSSEPQWINMEHFVNNKWGFSKGIQQYFIGGDALNLTNYEGGTYFKFFCTLTDKENYTFELIRTADNSIISSQSGSTLSCQDMDFIIYKNQLTYGTYKWKISYRPFYDYNYGTSAVGWKTKEQTFQYTAIVSLSLNPILWEGQSGAYYKNETTGETASQFQIYAAIPTPIKAYAPSGYNFVMWSDGVKENPRSFNISANTSGIYAIFKKANSSNFSSAFANNGQRKVVRDKNGIYHMVYESMNMIWYKKSLTPDYQGAWSTEELISLLPGDPTLLYCNPSISINTYNSIYPAQWLSIVFELKESVDAAEIFVVNKDLVTGAVTPLLEYETIDVAYFGQAKPVVASFEDEIFVVFRRSSSSTCLEYLRYYLNGSTWQKLDPVLPLPNTYASSRNPSIVSDDNDAKNSNVLHLAWQQGIESIHYEYSIDGMGGSSRTFLGYQNISSASGYTWNYNPSIIGFNGYSKVVWIGKRAVPPPENLAKVENKDGTTIVTDYEYRTIFRDPSYYRYWGFGSLVNSPSINKTNNNSAYVFSWSEINGIVTNKFADNSLSTIRTLNTTGKDLQLCNGSDKNTMFATSFNNTTLPYNLTFSQSIGSVVLEKENTGSINLGREGVVVKDSSQLYFTLGDVLVNGEKMPFKIIPDTFSVTSINDLNNYVKTNPFSVNDNTSLMYSVQYGVTDEEQLRRIFTESDAVSFRIELVDGSSEEVLGIFDDISYTKQNAVSYDNLCYEVSTAGIGNRTIYLRLVTTTSAGFNFSLTDKLDNQSIIAKRYVKQITYKDAVVVKEYALTQNYPNPFNPVTTINYQLPKSGSVTLKIFDILGNEIRTLVNEQKETGKYTAQFDASSLASGMYVYQLRVNDYTAVKKMLLLK